MPCAFELSSLPSPRVPEFEHIYWVFDLCVLASVILSYELITLRAVDEIPSDAHAAVLLLRSELSPSLRAVIPRIVFQHQVYTVIPNRFVVV